MEPIEKFTIYDLLNAAQTYIRATLSGNVPYHEENVRELNKRLLQRPLGKPGIQNNPYDRAKNWSGGYDFALKGYTLDEIRDLGLAYQLYQDSNNRMDEIQDFHQNMAGALAAIRDMKAGKPKTMEEILIEAEKYGLQR